GEVSGRWFIDQDDHHPGDFVETIPVTARADLTDAHWAVLESLLPKGKKPGRPPKWSKRQLIDGIRWRIRVGSPWRDVPAQYGPWRTVYGLYRRWQRKRGICRRNYPAGLVVPSRPTTPWGARAAGGPRSCTWAASRAVYAVDPD